MIKTIGVGILLISAPAWARPREASAEPTPARSDVAKPASKGAHIHDGFFFRFAIGLGHFTDSVVAKEPAALEFSTIGLSAVIEHSFGGTPAPGIVVGVGAYNHLVPSAQTDELQVGTATIQSADIEWNDSKATLYAPFVDIYPNPNDGFHIQAAVGYVRLAAGQSTAGRSTFTEEETFGGIGLLAGIGYESFVSDQWSLGVIGRVMSAFLFGQAKAVTSFEAIDYSHTLLAPSVLLALTYH